MGKPTKTVRHYATLKKYGLTEAQYNDKLDKQPYCYICGIHTSDHIKGLCLDHNHETGCVRKFLCSRCNMLVGVHELDQDIFYLVMAYILEHEEE